MPGGGMSRFRFDSRITYVKQITLKVQMSPSPPKHRDKSMRPSTSGWSKLTSRKYVCCQMLQVYPGPLLRICNWVGHLSQGTKNNVKRGPEKNRNFEKSKNRKIEKIEKSKNRNFADRNFLFDYFSIFHCPEREGKGIAEILRKEYWNKD